MTWTMWAALIVVVGTVWALIKRYETRLVLLTSGLIMTILSLDPMAAFAQFDKSMTNNSLINKLGILLLPCCMIVTGITSLAISSLSGMCAAIGPTIVALMIRAGFRPAMAAATVIASTLPSFWSPGSSHNGFVAKLAEWPVMDFITYTGFRTLLISIVCIVFLTVACFIFGDFKKGGFENEGVHKSNVELPEHPNILWAFAPLLPVVLLFVIAFWFPNVKMSVATAMLFGFIYTMIVTRSNPTELIKKFFDGMGHGYGSIIGLIIAAGVFAAGLRTCGVIDVFVEYLKNSSEVAKLGAAIGPMALGIMTGSGDAAGFAFNEAVTPHAPEFGMTIPDLGYLAIVSATLGRVSSPIAAGVIIIAGIANVSPIEVIKRSLPVNAAIMVFLYFIS